jgi:hypothetical protein
MHIEMYKWEMQDKDVGNNGRQGREEVEQTGILVDRRYVKCDGKRY